MVIGLTRFKGNVRITSDHDWFLQDLFDSNKDVDSANPGDLRTAIQCGGDGTGADYITSQCGAGDISRITQPATLIVRASENGPEVVAEDLYNVPSALLLPQVKKRRSNEPVPRERKKKVPTVGVHVFTSSFRILPY